jgi:hypothetical protein
MAQATLGVSAASKPIVPGKFQDTNLDRWSFNKRGLALRNEGQLWYPTFMEISEYENPTRGHFYEKRPNVGEKINHKTLLNSVAEDDFDTLASGMISGLTSPSRPWFKPEIDDPDLMEFTPVKAWLDQVQKIMFDIYAKSNVYGSLYTIYNEVGSFATACAFLEEDYRDIVRMRAYTIGEYYLGCDQTGRVNAFYRRFWMTAAQIIEKFGKGNATPATIQSFMNQSPDTWNVVNHLIEVNDDRIDKYKDFANMPFRSIYWQDGAQPMSYLKLGGYEEFPILAPRWATTTTADTYGKGPGWKALGDAKMAQKLESDLLIAIAKSIKPPLQADASIQGDPNVAPDGVTRSSSLVPNAGVRPVYQVNLDLNAVISKIAKTEASIHRKTFADLFKMMLDAERTGQPVTAEQIIEEKNEKMSMLGPVLERLETELLDPMNDRTYNIALRMGLIPPPPKEIQGMPIKMKYISVLAQAQRMMGIQVIDEWVTGVGNLANAKQDPSIWDIVNTDEVSTEKGERLGVPARIMNDPNARAALRKARAEIQAQQQKIQAANAAAEIAQKASGALKNASQSPLGPQGENGGNSALDSIVAGMKGAG